MDEALRQKWISCVTEERERKWQRWNILSFSCCVEIASDVTKQDWIYGMNKKMRITGIWHFASVFPTDDETVSNQFLGLFYYHWKDQRWTKEPSCLRMRLILLNFWKVSVWSNKTFTYFAQYFWKMLIFFIFNDKLLWFGFCCAPSCNVNPFLLISVNHVLENVEKQHYWFKSHKKAFCGMFACSANTILLPLLGLEGRLVTVN